MKRNCTIPTSGKGVTRERTSQATLRSSPAAPCRKEKFIYLNKFEEGQRKKSLPTRDFPIVQSYVDPLIYGNRERTRSR